MLRQSVQNLVVGSSDDDNNSVSSTGSSSPTVLSFEEEVSRLKNAEYSSYRSLKQKWQEEYPDSPYDGRLILRFAQCHDFDVKKVFKKLEAYDPHYLSLSAKRLKPQLLSKVCYNDL